MATTTQVYSTGGSYYPIVGRSLEQRAFDHLLVKKFMKKDGYRRYAIQDFGSSGWSEACGGKTFRDVDLRVIINGEFKRFPIDPEDKHWFDRLRGNIATSVGLGHENASQICLFAPGSDSPMTGDVSDLDVLSRALPNTIIVRAQPGSGEVGNAMIVPPLPTYQLTTPSLKVLESPAFDTTTPGESTFATATERTPSEQRRLVNELVAKLRDQVTKNIPDQVVALPEKDYRSVRSAVLQQLSSPEFYDNTSSGYNAFWNTSQCPDIGSAITELSSDVAAQVCKIQEGITGIPGPEKIRNGLIGCKLWDEWKCKMRRWKRKLGCRSVCPTEAPGCGYADERLYKVSAPIGSEAVSIIQNQLIASTLESPYLIGHHCYSSSSHHHHHHHDEDSDSSDEEPSNESMDCTRRRRHYRTPTVTTFIEAKHRSAGGHGHKSLTLGGGGSVKSSPHVSKSSPHAIGSPKSVGTPKSIGDQLLSNLKPIACKSCDGDNNSEVAVQNVACKTCGHGCSVCGTRLCSICGKCPTCSACGHVQSAGCGMCDKSMGGGGDDLIAQLAISEPKGLPDHGKSSVCFKNESGGGDKVIFRIGDSYRTHAIGPLNGVCATLSIPAGKYDVTVESATTGLVLGQLKDAPILQRVLYQFTFTSNGSIVQTAVDRFQSDILSMASRFLRDEKVAAYLMDHPSGVMFAPSNEALSQSGVGNVSDYFVSGSDPLALLRQRSENLVAGSDELSLVSDSGRSSFLRNNESSKIWNSQRLQFSNILGSAKHDKYPNVIVVVVDVPISDLFV